MCPLLSRGCAAVVLLGYACTVLAQPMAPTLVPSGLPALPTITETMPATIITSTTTTTVTDRPSPVAVFPSVVSVDTTHLPVLASDTCGFLATRECNSTCPRATLTQTDVHRQFSVVTDPRCVCGSTQVAELYNCSGRVNPSAHPARNAFDSDSTSSWQATRGRTNVTLAVDLEKNMDIVSIEFSVPAPYLPPDSASLETSIDGIQWSTILWFRASCSGSTDPCGLVSANGLTFATGPSTPTNHARFIRIRFLEFSSRASLQNRVFAIANSSIVARRHCNGHATSVDAAGNCVCEHGTAGPDCDRCTALFNRKPWRPGNGSHANACLACSCNNSALSCAYNATIDSDPDSRQNGDGGQCNCLNNTFGQHCVDCLDGYFRGDAGQCEPCACHVAGTVPGTVCASVDGQCDCRPGVSGRQCDMCPQDLFGPLLNSNTSRVCTECNCSDIGSISTQCSTMTGECSCRDGYSGAQCRSCDHGFFEVERNTIEVDVQCQRCSPLCAECTGSGNSVQVCSRCAIAQNGTHCVSRCPSGMFADELQQCQVCSSQCEADCVDAGASTSSCDSCRNVELNGVCVERCPPLHYVDEDGVCQECDDQCHRACVGSGPANCTGCQNFEEHGRCSDTCSENAYASLPNVSFLDYDSYGSSESGSSSGSTESSESFLGALSIALICFPCSSACEGCHGPGPGNCRECARGTARLYVWDSVLGQSRLQCAERCPSTGFFESNSRDTRGDLVRECIACHVECRGGLCDGASARNCTACNNYDFAGECVSTCPVGTYIDSSTNSCLSCPSNCSWCTGPTTSECPACERGLVFRPSYGCATECGNNEFEMNGICRSCGAHCARCNSNHTCDQCEPMYALHRGACFAESMCPVMTFARNGTCIPCSSLCGSGCSGPTNQDCDGCRFVQMNGTCLNRCPMDMYPMNLDNGEQECDFCSDQCGAGGCSGPTSADCFECAGFTHGNDCVASCPMNSTFVRGSECVPCHPQCDRDVGGCSGPLASDCHICANSHLQIGHVSNCVSHCPTGFFEDESNGRCLECADVCHNCLGNGTELGSLTGCVGCSTFTHGQECVLNCPDGTYGNASMICIDCDEECRRTCFGPGPSRCGLTSRAPSHQDCVHAIRNQTCVEHCDPMTEYLQSQRVPICQSCNAQCDGVNGCVGPDASQCRECRNARLGRTCVEECPIGMIMADSNTRVCVDCHSQCHINRNSTEPSCSGLTALDCTACLHFSRQGRCVDHCDSLTEFVDSNRTCSLCHPSCGSNGCFGPDSDDCTACPAWRMPTGECTQICPPEYFSNRDTMQCQPCSPLCAERSSCPTGTGASHCTVCGSSFRQDGTCVATCHNNTFVVNTNSSGSMERACLPCDASCDAGRGCSGPLPSDCNRCASLELVQATGSTCVDSCPAMHYRIGGQCRPCNPNCLVGCSGGSALNCTAVARQPIVTAGDLGCRHSAVIFSQSDVECVSSCRTGRFRDALGICVHCSPSCGEVGCDGPFPSNCTGCPPMEYLDRLNGQCRPCHTQCNIGCSGPSSSDCTACQGVNADGVCMSDCGALNGSHYQTINGANEAVCSRCSSLCRSGSGCSGATDADCGACRAFLVQSTGRCSTVCPDSTFANGTVCVDCDASCRMCTGPLSTDCIICEGVLLRNGQCGGQCPPNEVLAANGRCVCPDISAFVDDADVCTPCHSQCNLGCNGASAQDCLGGAGACRSGILARNGTCVERCPIHELLGPNGVCFCPVSSAFISHSGRCEACHEECSDGCSGVADTECSGFPESCVHVYENVTSRCLHTCPIGTETVDDGRGGVECVCSQSSYFDVSGACLPCHHLCAQCTGPDRSQCTSCRGYTDTTGHCTTRCPEDTFVDVVSRQCVPCSSQCAGSCSRPRDSAACLQSNGTRCRNVFEESQGCSATCSFQAPFVDIVGRERVCRAACPLGKPFHNDTRGVAYGQIEGSLCVSSCSELPGTVRNMYSENGPACSIPSVEAADALGASRSDESDNAASISTTAIVAIVVCSALLVVALIFIHRSQQEQKSDAKFAKPPIELDPVGSEPGGRLPRHMDSICFSPTYQNPYGQFALTPQTPSDINAMSTPRQTPGYVSAYTLAGTSVMETPL